MPERDILLERHQAARVYIDSIRNKAKREYGEAYYLHVIRNGHAPDTLEAKLASISPVELPYMTAQAVRLRLGQIMRGEQ